MKWHLSHNSNIMHINDGFIEATPGVAFVELSHDIEIHSDTKEDAQIEALRAARDYLRGCLAEVEDALDDSKKIDIDAK